MLMVDAYNECALNGTQNGIKGSELISFFHFGFDFQISRLNRHFLRLESPNVSAEVMRPCAVGAPRPPEPPRSVRSPEDPWIRV